MEKEVYLETLSAQEIIKRLRNNEQIYKKHSPVFFSLIDGFLVRFKESQKPDLINCTIPLDEEKTYYFLDDIELDESYIGTLCKFWDSDENDFHVSKLHHIINKDVNFPYGDGKTIWRHCCPLTLKEAEQLIKEK